VHQVEDRDAHNATMTFEEEMMQCIWSMDPEIYNFYAEKDSSNFLHGNHRSYMHISGDHVKMNII
jgi:hypothetical protein